MSCASVITPLEVLAADDLGRRRDWTDEEKIRIVEESLQGHRQGSATARRYGLSRSLLTVWRRQFKRQVAGGGFAHGFVPLAIAPAEDTGGEVVPQPQCDDVRVEIVLPNGRRLTIPATLDPGLLARLLLVLDAS